MNRYTLLLVICILSPLSYVIAQEELDVIYLNDGSRIIGTIIEQIPNQSITVRARDGSEVVITFERISRIRRETIEEEPKDMKKVSYAELGATVGTPTGINGAFGYCLNTVGVRVSGMYIKAGERSQLSGFQLNFGYRLSDNVNRNHTLAVVGGSTLIRDSKINVADKRWSYLGVVYNLNSYGFFLEAGLSAGEGSYSSPQLLFQIGYMHRFLPGQHEGRTE